MKLWPSLARWPGLFLLILAAGYALAACQAGTDVPWATVEATTVGSTPTPLDSLGPSATAQPSPTVSATPRPTPALKGQTIEFWHPWQGELAKRVERAVLEFNLTNEWGFRVQARPFYSSGALVDAVEAGLKEKENGAPGESGLLDESGLPDVLAAPSDRLVAWSAWKGTPNGAVIGLDEFLEDPNFGFSEEQRTAFYPAFWEQDQAGEQQVGIPALRTARVIFYNESWAKELGFSGPPKTPSEFRAQACAAAQKNNTSRIIEKYGTGGWIIDHDALTALSWLSAFGAQPVPVEAGKPYAFETKEAKEAWTFLRGMLDDGCAWLSRDPAPYEYFSKRMALFYSGTLPEVLTQSHWQEKYAVSDRWKILPFMSKDGKPVVYSSGYSYGVIAAEPEGKSDTELAAWLFIRWMEKPEVAAKLVQALPSLPVSSAHAAQLKDVQSQFPMNMILPLTEAARPAPTLESWGVAHRMVEDATWQLFHSTVEQVPEILPFLNEALQELNKTP